MANAAVIATLRSSAQSNAQALVDQFPQVVLTSGRRSVEDQARAMAVDALRSGDPHWIEETYATSSVSRTLQSALLQLWDTGEEFLTQGFLEALQRFDEVELRDLSWHLSGDAFDIEPIDDLEVEHAITAMVALHRQNGGRATFLTHEGGLTRWHVQFSPELVT